MTGYGTRSRRIAAGLQGKLKKIPAHLAMSVESGSDSDPNIKAPGWYVSFSPCLHD